MARYIEIKKIGTAQNTYYYQVTSPDFPNVDLFYIGLNANNQSIYFFKNKNFEIPNVTIILSDQNKKIEAIDWLPSFLFYGTLVKAKEALQSNNFSDYISFQS